MAACECGRDATVRETYCRTCYQRHRRKGTLTLLPERRAQAASRRLTSEELWARVEQHIDAEGDCWLWTGSFDKDGYGMYSNRRAHRLVHEMLVGPIPKGLTSDHLCRVRSCVNPDHVEMVTVAVNNWRKPAGARRAATARYKFLKGRHESEASRG